MKETNERNTLSPNSPGDNELPSTNALEKDNDLMEAGKDEIDLLWDRAIRFSFHFDNQ